MGETPQRHQTRLLVVAVALAGAAGAAALAGRPAGGDRAGSIHACRHVRTGTLRVVGSTAGCRSGERALAWNVRGQKGDPGLEGAIGPQGPSGPAGRTGATGASGARGATGAAGASGASGPRGATGPPGSQGPPGPELSSFDALSGLPCTLAGVAGAITIAYDPSGVVTMTCVASGDLRTSLYVNEIETGGPTSAADEFVEIVNSGSVATDIGGYKLVYRSAAGTSDVALSTVPAGIKLSSGSFYLFAGSGYSGSAQADQNFSGGLASTGGGVGFRDSSGGLVDSAGWGTATNVFVETNAAPAPPSGSSIVRVPDGHDTGDNGADFSIAETPTPRASNGS